MIWQTICLIRNILVFQRGALNCSRLNGGQGGVGNRETGARMSKPLKVEDWRGQEEAKRALLVSHVLQGLGTGS